MDKKCCSKCKYWDDSQFREDKKKVTGVVLLEKNPETKPKIGYCCRFPPKGQLISVAVQGRSVMAPEAVWPLTAGEEWCGEFDAS